MTELRVKIKWNEIKPLHRIVQTWDVNIYECIRFFKLIAT